LYAVEKGMRKRNRKKALKWDLEGNDVGERIGKRLSLSEKGGGLGQKTKSPINP